MNRTTVAADNAGPVITLRNLFAQVVFATLAAELHSASLYKTIGLGANLAKNAGFCESPSVFSLVLKVFTKRLVRTLLLACCSLLLTAAIALLLNHVAATQEKSLYQLLQAVLIEAAKINGILLIVLLGLVFLRAPDMREHSKLADFLCKVLLDENSPVKMSKHVHPLISMLFFVSAVSMVVLVGPSFVSALDAFVRFVLKG